MVVAWQEEAPEAVPMAAPVATAATVAAAVVAAEMAAAAVAVEYMEESRAEVAAGWAWSTGCQAAVWAVAAEAEDVWAGVG